MLLSYRISPVGSWFSMHTCRKCWLTILLDFEAKEDFLAVALLDYKFMHGNIIVNKVSRGASILNHIKQISSIRLLLLTLCLLRLWVLKNGRSLSIEPCLENQLVCWCIWKFVVFGHSFHCHLSIDMLVQQGQREYKALPSQVVNSIFMDATESCPFSTPQPHSFLELCGFAYVFCLGHIWWFQVQNCGFWCNVYVWCCCSGSNRCLVSTSNFRTYAWPFRVLIGGWVHTACLATFHYLEAIMQSLKYRGSYT